MQTSFPELEYAAKKKLTRRDRFLAEIEVDRPWAALEVEIAPFCPKGEGPGRPPIDLHRMLWTYNAQQCFGLSDEGVDNALCGSQAIRRFDGIDLLARETARDATTRLKLCRPLETNERTRKAVDAISAYLAECGWIRCKGTLVDAAFFAAPPSTGNKARGPERHQAKKGNNWYFGMKAHIGVDAKSSLIHAVIGAAANVGDVSRTPALVHGEEFDVIGGASYQGVEKRPVNQGFTADWHIAKRLMALDARGTS